MQTLGTIWASSLFPGRAPKGWQTLSSYIGGATNPELGSYDEDKIVETVHQDISRILLGPNPPSPKILAVHLWQKAIPQYNLGHPEILERIDRGLKSAPGLYLSSNYMDGVALGDCVRRGRERSEEITRYLQQSRSS